MRKLSPILVVVASLAFASSATAEDITNSWLVKRDLAVAVQYWRGHPDPCLSYTVETGPTPYLAETEIGGCTQRWNVELWHDFVEALDQAPNARPLWPGDKPQTRRIEYLRWSCVLAVHEFGHTVGLADETSSRADIMFAQGGLGQKVTACTRAYR